MTLKGTKFTEEHKRKIGLANSIALRGRKNPKHSEWMKGKRPSIETRIKRSESLKRAYKEGRRTNYKGGISHINEVIRKSLEYKLWRESVYKRDNYTCIWCGQVGGKLNADHIKPFSLFPELRFAIDNGRTLCYECHKKTDTYGELAKKYIVE